MQIKQTKIQICCKISMASAVIVLTQNQGKESKCYHHIHAVTLTKHSTAPKGQSGIHSPPPKPPLSPFMSTYWTQHPAGTYRPKAQTSDHCPQRVKTPTWAWRKGLHSSIPQLPAGLVREDVHTHMGLSLFCSKKNIFKSWCPSSESPEMTAPPWYDLCLNPRGKMAKVQHNRFDNNRLLKNKPMHQKY